MNLDTALAVLAKASLFDPAFSNPDKGMAVAWGDALADVDRDDALQAVTFHYRRNSHRLMPTNILEIVAAIRRNRLAEDPEPIPDADPDDVPAYLGALRAGRVRQSDGTERARPARELVEATFHHTQLPPPRYDRQSQIDGYRQASAKLQAALAAKAARSDREEAS